MAKNVFSAKPGKITHEPTGFLCKRPDTEDETDFKTIRGPNL